MLQVDSSSQWEPDGVDATGRLRRAFEVARGGSAFMDLLERGALRDSVCAFVQVRKTAGATIESIIVAVKSLAREAGLDGFAERPVEDAVRWCIAEYYRSETPPNGNEPML